MQLGWIDFSKEERKKILDVLSLLEPRGTLDELGIAQIRDGFSDLFFPGSSTIQTRAKYFFLVPYAFRCIEEKGETNPKKFQKAVTEIEKQCAIQLLENNPSEYGIIGELTLKSTDYKGWVKRSPSDIYWAGLRKYNFFCFRNSISINQYIHIFCNNLKDRDSISSLGNSRDNNEEFTVDDSFSGVKKAIFWNVPKCDFSNQKWIKDITIDLTKEEATFLKKQIINQCPDSLYSIILDKYQRKFKKCETFEDLELIIKDPSFPNKEIEKQFELAKQFSEFNYLLRVVYNKIIFEDKYDYANDEYQECMNRINKISDLNIEQLSDVFSNNGNDLNDDLKTFLINSKNAMQLNNLKERENQLKKLIKDREIFLKGEKRAKTCNPGKFQIPERNILIGGDYLDYRFTSTVRTIINDIIQGEKNA